MAELVEGSTLVERLEYGVQTADDLNQSPGMIILKPLNSELREIIEQTILRYAFSKVNFLGEKDDEKQCLDWVAQYKDSIGIYLQNSGKKTESIKEKIIEFLENDLGQKIEFEKAGSSHYRKKAKTAEKILADAYK